MAKAHPTTAMALSLDISNPSRPPLHASRGPSSSNNGN